MDLTEAKTCQKNDGKNMQSDFLKNYLPTFALFSVLNLFCDLIVNVILCGNRSLSPFGLVSAQWAQVALACPCCARYSLRSRLCTTTAYAEILPQKPSAFFQNFA